MAFLGSRGDRAGAIWRGVAALVTLGLVGCFLVESSDAEGPVFSHEVHVVQQSMTCAVCHQPREDADGLDMPTPELCRVCHDALDAAKAWPRRADGLYHESDLVTSRPPAFLGADVRFSHDAHTGWTKDCGSCHVGIERSAHVAEVPRLGMDACTACHAQRGIDIACSSCHVELDVDVAPSSHGPIWMQTHGSAWRHPTEGVVDRCDMCHTESTCVQCHKSELPKSHTNTWRTRTHGFEASFDRTACQVCHTDDSCSRCHEVVEPLSHSAGWGSPMDTHCMACHFPLSNESCVVCHKGTPSHGMATPLPPGHYPGFDCRQCHGNGAPLPHVDNGASCTACHK